MSLSGLCCRQELMQNVRQLLSLSLNPGIRRQGHVLRGKPPGVAKTLKQRLQEENIQDPILTAQVNIGFPRLRPSRSTQFKERLQHIKNQHSNNELEKKARNNSLLIDLDQVEKDYGAINRCHDVRVIANHYGVFKDLFGTAYFVPRVQLNIEYQVANGESYMPVYNGNVIKPLEARLAPKVSFDGVTDPITGERSKESTSFWTLVATNPDGHFTQPDREYLHWMIGNIPNGELSKGEMLTEYLPPFPPKGIGFQRFIFVLYRQTEKIDFGDSFAYKLKPEEYANLEKRTFSTLDFYREYQDVITPAGLAFFQTDYDKSLTSFYHNILDMKEPIYEYDFPAIYLADQKFFPLKQPFNIYLDRYRDIKLVNREYLERKLAKTHPFNGPEPEPLFPNAYPLKNMPSWLKTEKRKERLKYGRINDYLNV